MCHGPGRPSGLNSAPNRPSEPRMPAQGPTNEPPSGQYDPATRVSPSPGARTPGLAPKPPRRGRQGVFRTQNRPKVPPGAAMASQLPWQLNFSCNQLAIPVHVDGPELLSTHWGRWVPRKSIRATPYHVGGSIRPSLGCNGVHVVWLKPLIWRSLAGTEAESAATPRGPAALGVPLLRAPEAPLMEFSRGRLRAARRPPGPPGRTHTLHRLRQ